MNIAIIAAMGKELALLKPMLSDLKVSSLEGFNFFSGTVGKHNIVAMQCGIGKVNAAIGTFALINNFHPDLVINTGVAGGATDDVKILDVVVGAQVAYHDVWCGPENPWGTIQGLPQYYDGDEDVMEALPEGNNVKHGLICSGDRFIDSTEDIEKIKELFPEVLAVDMESAAIAQVCLLRNTRFISIRVISDVAKTSSDNTTQYIDFWQDAPQHMFATVNNLLNQI